MARRRALVMIAALMAGSLACSTVTGLFRAEEESGTAPGVAEAEQTVEATEEGPSRLELEPTPTPFHVMSEDDPRSILDLAHPDHTDGFDRPDAWFDYDTKGRARYWVADSALHGIDYEPEEIYTWWSNNDTASGNLYAEVSATNGDCVGRDSVGLVIRVDAESNAGGYSLEVSCDGAYRFRLHQIGGDQVELIDWTPSDAIHTGPGATNRLGLWAYQARFNLFLNGQEVNQYWDTHYRHSFGMFALYVRASQTYDLTATFDDFAYWDIDYIP